jgi:hypothetical protein
MGHIRTFLSDALKDSAFLSIKASEKKNKEGTSKCLDVNARNRCVNRQETSSVPIDWLNFGRGGVRGSVTH